MQRRALVLTDETARHPFRANLPPFVLREAEPVPVRTSWRLTRGDVTAFAATYIACFTMAVAFFW
ncbi:hypothetical protein [Tsuneonella mangrovi]|uniref:hypothetical protein n=1 Tax=Tsuneonella mangrovi TaxID=1982042 RepID=UPI000BA22990|nr:hypothetical protein [Tsuneonella mangrovi]